MKKAAGFLLLLGLGGCGTFFSGEHAGPRIYGGVRFDFQAVYERPGLLILFPIDFPLCLAIDTIILPYSVGYVIVNGERSLGPIFEEDDGPRGVVEGYVVEAERPGYVVIPLKDWPPPGIHPLMGAKVAAFSDPKDPPLVTAEGRTEDPARYILIGRWKPGWKSIHIDCDGYLPLEIRTSDLHDPTDHTYWAEHRLLIRITRRR